MEAALKTSFRSELSFVKSSLVEDGLQNGAAACEDFSVDDLLDFSNEEEDDDVEEEEEFVEKLLPRENDENDAGLVDVSNGGKDEFDPVPEDDVASLEWLSHFVEDSNAEYATPFPPGIHFPKVEEEEKKRFGPGEPESGMVFLAPVPARARSKRTRTGVRVWSLGAPSSTESSSSSTTSSYDSYSSPNQQTGGACLFSCPVEPVRRPGPGRKSKKARRGEGEGRRTGAQLLVGGRRCSHCGVQKTPQWRAGPLGAKTLCNACGVRFKSGRLLPEYRPACSPTFSSELHSNSHRKVLEMRKMKEEEEVVVVVGGQVELPGLNPTLVSPRVGPKVPSFG